MKFRLTFYEHLKYTQLAKIQIKKAKVNVEILTAILNNEIKTVFHFIVNFKIFFQTQKYLVALQPTQFIFNQYVL